MYSTALIALMAALSVVLWYGSIFLHEAGHAIAALAMRIPLRSVDVGKGKRLLTVTIGGVPLTFRLRPLGGVTRTRVRASRGRHLVFSLGGIVVNLLLATAGVLLIARAGRVALLLVLVNGAMFIENAVPIPADPPRRPRPSDGWVVLSLIFRPNKVLRSTLGTKLRQWKQPEDR